MVADVAGYMEVDGEHPWSALTDAWFGKRLLTIEKALSQLPKTRQRAAQELQRIVEFRMSLQGLMAPGDQLRQCAPALLRCARSPMGAAAAAARARRRRRSRSPRWCTIATGRARRRRAPSRTSGAVQFITF